LKFNRFNNVSQVAQNADIISLYYRRHNGKDAYIILDDRNIHLDKGKLCESTGTQSGV